MMEPHPAMPTPNQTRRDENGWPRTTLTVMFADPAHFADSIDYCRARGQLNELLMSIGGIVSMFRTDAAGSTALMGQPPVKPRVVRLTFRADSRVRPSFTWVGEELPDIPGGHPKMLLHGGLIYRDNSGWSVHT
jgi:hypothetical protein